MALVTLHSNPFDPLAKPDLSDQFSEELTIREWLQKTWPDFIEFQRPTICLYNGNPLLRKEWPTTKLKEGDIVNFVTLPGGPLWVWVVVSLVVAVVGVVVALANKPRIPVTQQTPEADSVYNLRGQRNQVKLGMPIESPYGQNRLFPAYAAQSYNKYIDNQQWLYQLFCVGHGKYVFDQLQIEDTPLANFKDVEYEIIPPGSPVTLFPDNVETSPEVGGIELFGPNEPESGAVWIEDSPGDDELDPPIAPTGHYGTSGNAGPFVANGINTQANKLEVDISFPKGLYIQNDAGGLSTLSVTVVFEARKIDNNGVPIGDWFELSTFTKTLATTTPQRFTIEADVELGRYEVRGRRTSNKNTDAKAGNTVQWEQLRAFIQGDHNYGAVTLIALKARASNNLNDNAASRFNVIATRMLPVYIGGEWQPEQVTRGIVWAFCDVFRAEYGARLADALLDMDTMLALDQVYTDRQEFFDGVFDQRTTVWEAARAIALVGRAVPMLNGSRVTMVRDEQKTMPTAVFNQENIVAGSFNWQVKLNNIDSYDGLEITYIDSTTWKEATVLCLVGSEAGDYPEKLTLQGVISRQHAYRVGMYLRGQRRWLRENITFRTGLEGHIPSYGDLIAIAYDIPRWGQGGMVKNATGPALAGETPVQRILELNEPVTFGVGTSKILLRKNNGSVLGPLTATPGVDAYHISVMVTASTWEDFAFDGSAELPVFLFGLSNEWGRHARVVGLNPSEDDTVEVVCSNYDSRVFDGDELEPPAGGNDSGNVPGTPKLPEVTGLLVIPSPQVPGEVIASWNPMRGAEYYIVQLSYDGVAYAEMGKPTETTLKFQVLPKFLYVRVAAVGAGAGEWAYWTGNSPAVASTASNDLDVDPDPVTGVTLQAGFGLIYLKWVNPTNTALDLIEIFESSTTTPPVASTFELPIAVGHPGPTSYFRDGLPDNATRYYWFRVRSTRKRYSTVAGPFSTTTVNGITLDHLIPGGLQPVEIVSVMPSTGNYQGRIVYLTANDLVGGTFDANKLYRWTSSVTTTGKAHWTAAVPAVDITGQLTNAQIADLAAAKITGQITTTQITDDAITTPKIFAGSVTTAKIAALAVTANEIAANAITAVKIAAGEVTTAKLAAGAVTANELAADAVTAGKIQAGAIVAAAVGANEIITYSANIADAIITSAKIASLEAGKISAGTITAAISLETPKLSTLAALYNTGTPANTFPVVGYQNAQEPSSPMTGFSGVGTDFWMITYYGWATGSGFALDRFGKADMLFVCLENGGCTPTALGWVDLEIICRVNGGSPFQVNPYAVRAIAGNGGLNINGAVLLSGLGSTDTVEFGIRIKANSGSDQWNVGNLTILAHNL
jgi:sulfur carrier protein ThiS